MPWEPRLIRFVEVSLRTAAETVRVATDAGTGYLKALGNRGGPHRLAADWVATQLAQWLGLPVFEFAIIRVLPENDIAFQRGGCAQPGPAFITKHEPGDVWSGDAKILSSLVNPEHIGLLVLFDTWVRNVDRYPPNPQTRHPNRNNVYLSKKDLPDGKWRLIAMDHTHCFDGPGYLNANLGKIDFIQDEQIYGLFPEFKPFLRPHRTALLAGVDKLKTLHRSWVDQLVGRIPAEWQVDGQGRTALAKLVYDRAGYVAETFIPTLERTIGLDW